jgi:hypothetical protein
VEVLLSKFISEELNNKVLRYKRVAFKVRFLDDDIPESAKRRSLSGRCKMVMQDWMLQSYDAHELAELSDKRVDKYVDGLYVLIVYIVDGSFPHEGWCTWYTELYIPSFTLDM